MAIVDSVLSNVSLYGTLTIWGHYSYPVFELDEIKTAEDILNKLADSYQGFKYMYDNYYDSMYLVVGTQAEDLYLAQKIADIYNLPQEEDIPFSWGPNGEYTGIKHIGVSGTVGKNCAISIWYQPTQSTTNHYNNAVYSIYKGETNVVEPGTITFLNYNGGGSGFIKITENGKPKYVRVYTCNYILSPYKYVIVTGCTDRDIDKVFFGCPANIPLDISEIASGNATIEVGPKNPYDPIGPSGPTDHDIPTGTFDDTSDPIPDSSLPTISAANTGFTRIYNPTLSQVQQLARYLWTDESVIQTIWNHIKQYFEDPMQAIIGFNLVPVPVPDGGTQNFALMYIDTGVPMTVAANQFVDIDCGNLKLDYYYGSALDHSPYTKIHCFLPFIGTVRVNTDEVMGKTLQIKYRVDIVTGSCVAKIFVDGSCLYQYSGHCAINIPISSADFSSYVSAAINVAKSAAMGAIAGMSAGAPALAEETGLALNIPNSLGPATSLAVQDKIPVGPQSPVYPASSTPANLSGMNPKNISNTVSQISGGKPHIEHSGAFSGNSGYLGIRRPFLIIERPNMCLPENYQSLNGFPAMITMELGTCKGYTRIQQVQLTGLSATTNEQAEILNLLKGGVVF